MADKLFLQAFAHANVRRFERRLGLATSDATKSCGTRFLSKLESAIFSRAGSPVERVQTEEIKTSDFPRRDAVRG